MRLSSPVYSFLRFAEFCGKDESVSDPSKEAGLFSAGTDADGRTRRCWGREHGCRGCDTLPDRQNAPLIAADFRNFAAHRAINAAEVLSCSRQNIVDLAERWKLHPIKASEKSALYLGCRRFPAEYVREAKQGRFHENRRFSKTGESECFSEFFGFHLWRLFKWTSIRYTISANLADAAARGAGGILPVLPGVRIHPRDPF